ncbi:PucR C-terminal helix-turn-helix domain-containing protein [Microbacterium sp. cf046]|uniref:PucR family transcriptional regulator n=1 Tax=Microbacterium sp. cf046 TaxID=1761803 RepID=UPI0008E099C6|nr:PucR family transcriptional regulator [Microbacterium sp. cf046]SFR92355.1 PucR C-terminal helix-turn-helix domain-containing protein [Microbacterium sp. cf046]
MTPAQVADVAERVGPAIVIGAAGPVGRDVHDVIVTDVHFPAVLRAGSLVVAPGYLWGDEDCARLVSEADAAGVVAVAIKARATPGAEESPLAVLMIEPDADWALVIALLRSAVIGTPASSDADESLFGLADALASMCEGPVVLLDPAWQLISYSGGDPHDEVRSQTILARRPPAAALDGIRRLGVVDALNRGEIVRVADGEVEGLSRRYAVAARVGAEVLATIWWQPDVDVPLEEAERRLRRAAELAALALLRHAASAPFGSTDGDAALQSLLAGGRTERQVAGRLGTDIEGGFVLAGLRPTAADAHERAAAVRRLVALARTHCDAFRVNAQVAAGTDAAYLLFAAPDTAHRRDAVRVVTDMHARLQRTAPHRAMMSSTFRALGETAQVRQTVDELLLLAERRGWNALTDSEDVDATWRLEQFRELALAHPALLSGPIVRLVEHDRAEGTELVATLRSYFESVGDMRAVAGKLGIHVNTVRYRINRVQEVARFSLSLSDERLLAELQIRLLS